MKTWFRKICLIVVFAVLGNSCQAVMSERVTPLASSQGDPHVTIFPATLPVSSMPTITTPTAPISNFNFTCWPVKTLEEGSGIPGSMLYANFSRLQGKQPANGFFAWDLSSFQSIPINIGPHQLKFTEEVFQAPDGKSFALISENILLIISYNGVRSSILPGENLKIRAYLPDGRILLDPVNKLPYYRNGAGLTDIYYLFDPFTDKTTKYSAFLPYFVLSDDLWTLQYSPNMKYVLYRSSPGNDNIQFTLFDLQKSQVVWTGPVHNMSLLSFTVPAWRPDSSMLAAIYTDKTGHRNYYSISLDGKVSPMNNFNGDELFGPTVSNIWRNPDMAEFPNWSPTGQYMASAGYTNGEGNELPHLYIWNSEEQMLYKPCLPDEEKRLDSRFYINWSYDGSHVFVPLTYMQSPTSVEVAPRVYTPDFLSKGYVLDLVNRIIYAMPDFSDEDVFVQYEAGYNVFMGWVNWEFP